jgi:hypothetical protein
MAPVCRGIENARSAVGGSDVTGPEVSMEEARPDLPLSGKIIEEQMQSGSDVVVPKVGAVRVTG